MTERPVTLATHLAAGPGTDAEGAAAATFRFCGKLLDPPGSVVELPRVGGPRPGTKAVRQGAPGAPVIAGAWCQALPFGAAAAGPALPAPGSAPRGLTMGPRLLVAGAPPAAANDISQRSR
jgi:hypothetical protein